MPIASRPLDGRVAIVTGAGRNIGRAIALALAAEGAKVVVNARSNRAEADAVAAEIAAKGGAAIVALGDVSEPHVAGAIVRAAVDRFGRVDVLVNNAAVRKEQPIETLDYAQWRQVLGVVLDGAFHCVKACLPELKQSGTGAVINIGGVSGHTGAKHRAHVITAKAGLVGLTKALAHDLAEHAVTVNCVVPGLIDTRRDPTAGTPSHHSVNRTLLGRLGAPDDIAATVCFLAGPRGRYITGQTLHVNGGAYLN